DAVQQLRAPEGAPRPLERLQRFTTAAVLASFGLGVGATALLAWALAVRRRAARTGEVARSLLQTAADASREKPWSEEMLASLARQLGADRTRDLREILRHGGPHLKT